MKLKYFIILFALAAATALFSSGDRYRLETRERDSDIKLSFSREFFVNNVSLDFIFPFRLDSYFSRAELVSVMGEIYRDLSLNYQKVLSIPLKDGKELVIIFKSYMVDKKMTLLVLSNLDLKKKELVPPGGDFSGCYAKQYFIINEGLVPGEIYYMKDKEAEAAKFREGGDYNALADFYLFDDNADNDASIPGIIADGLKHTDDTYKMCLLRLTEAQYQLFKKHFDLASAAAGEAAKLAASVDDEKRREFIKVSAGQLDFIIKIAGSIKD